MTLYRKVEGVWVAATQAYVKRSGVWKLADDAYVKRSGVWDNAYHYDVTPPPPPEITLGIADRPKGNYINVGIRIPGVAHNTDVRRVRVLSTYNDTFPATQYGGTYTAGPDTDHPDEPWSEWRYNGFGTDHPDTSVLSYKQWPRNATGTSYLTGGKRYYFSAWTEDFAGNWSVATTLSILAPKPGVDSANVTYKQARFQPLVSGSMDFSEDFTSGRVIQANSPRSNGIWFYGSQITEAIGQTGPPETLKAQILISRASDDIGSATANLYIFRHNYANPVNLPANPSLQSVTALGTISKGESKWFSLPASYLTELDSDGIKGFGLYFKDPTKATAFAGDYSVIRSIDEYQRSGEVIIYWKEQL